MKTLNDYSGELLPEIQFSDFSRAGLIRLLDVYSKLFWALDGMWYLTLKERFGNEAALACDIEAWRKFGHYEMAQIRKGMNIQGSDPFAMMKAVQISPWFAQTRSTMERKDAHTVVLTVNQCPTRETLEDEGEGRENDICNAVCPGIFRDLALFFNPRMKVKCLKSSPRKDKEEICCQWECSEGE
ncbi:DUF6125 family protein [Chloroflexota bacterium]